MKGMLNLAFLFVVAFELNLSMASNFFVGNTYRVEFTEGAIYRNEFVSDTEFRYTGIVGDDVGRSELVKYTASQIAPNIFKIEWQEADKTTVVHVDDFEQGKVYVSITKPNKEFVHWEGTLTKIRSSSSYFFVGNTYRAEFDQGSIYMNEFLSDSQFRYTGIAGEDEGRSELVNYIATPITKDIFKIEWQEADKTTVVHVDDFGQGKAYVTVTTPEAELLTWQGSLQKQKEEAGFLGNK